LLAAFDDMRREFRGALAAGDGIEPFMGENPTASSGEYVSGPAGASWDALFFFRHGRRYDANHARFPRTGALLDALDLCRIDGQAPEICFSILRPHTRIEPHHGVTNARVVIHIPLRVPAGCFLEVTGVGRHFWQPGRAMVFDDTFEHSAENPSDEVRGILLMDSWHPDLSEPERAAFRALVEAITRIESLSLN
jgi:aspartate beta-hydroxylase